MNFTEALQALTDGKAIVRQSFEAKDGYLILMQGMKHVWRIIPEPVNAGNHIFSFEELNATDWELYGYTKPVCITPAIEEVQDAA